MKAKTVTVKVSHKNLGNVSVKIDAEDKDLFTSHKMYVGTFGEMCSPKVRVDSSSGEYASRVILEKHGLLDYAKNVFFRNGNSFDLTKKNLYQTA